MSSAPRRSTKWVVVITAPDQLTAEMWRELLVDAEIPARLGPGDVASFLGVSASPCRIMVPRERMAEAADVLSQYLTQDPPSSSGEASGPEAN